MDVYNKVGDVLKEMTQNKTSFKNAIYNRLPQFEADRNFKKIYKIVIEVTKNKKLIDDIIQTFYSDTSIKNYEVFSVLIHEKFISSFNKKIGGKLMKLLKSKEEEVKRFIKERQGNVEEESNSDNIQSNKMFFRINKQKEEPVTFESLSSHTNGGVLEDPNFKGLYHISKKSNELNKIFALKKTSEVIVQSKSSFIPAYYLANFAKSKLANDPTQSFDAIDACAAPGNKTLQLAEYFEKSNIFAFEINPERFETLKSNVLEINNFNNVVIYNNDFLKIDPVDETYSNVKVILADPSCSGSGTFNNSLAETKMNDCCLALAGSEVEQEQLERLKKLATFQRKILSHCMKFPNVKVISYSTCSVFMAENEYVVSKVLNDNPEFRLVKPASKEKFHNGLTDETSACVRICRKCHGIDGFYVALFERIEE